MTFEEACKILGYEEPPVVGDESRDTIIETVLYLTDHGAKPIDPRMANLCRAQIDEFA